MGLSEGWGTEQRLLLPVLIGHPTAPPPNQVSLKAGGTMAVEQAALSVCPRVNSVVLSLTDSHLSRT